MIFTACISILKCMLLEGPRAWYTSFSCVVISLQQLCTVPHFYLCCIFCLEREGKLQQFPAKRGTHTPLPRKKYLTNCYHYLFVFCVIIACVSAELLSIFCRKLFVLLKAPFFSFGCWLFLRGNFLISAVGDNTLTLSP